MKTSAKILLLLVIGVCLFASACKEDKKITPPVSFAQIGLADIKAHEAELTAQNTGIPIFYDNVAEARNFKVGSILFLKGDGPTIHYAKLEITSVSSTELIFNYMAYNNDGSVLVAEKVVTVSPGFFAFASWTGLFDADPASYSIGMIDNPIRLTTTAATHHIIVFRL
jgi:hypothetical protein